MSDMYTIYHNPRCSKSRQTLALLQAHGVQPIIVDYLKTPPDSAALSSILTILGIEPRELMRKNETAYAEHNLGEPSKTRAELIQAMIDNPILIERPIVTKGRQAILGRPPENVSALF